MTIEIALTQGKVALIDDEDFPMVSQRTWSAVRNPKTGRWNAQTNRLKHERRDGQSNTLLMHRLLLPDAAEIDHRNGDSLDNQRENLRPVTRSQNLANSRKKAGTSSYLKGVSWCKQTRKWRAEIRIQGGRRRLGRFTSEQEAGRAYDTAALAAWGEYACTNVMMPERQAVVSRAEARAQQNNFHNKRRIGASSPFCGVSWNRQQGKWTVNIWINSRQARLGSFTNEEDAARAYNVAALALRGDSARLNDV